jgi:hypothetical protein
MLLAFFPDFRFQVGSVHHANLQTTHLQIANFGFLNFWIYSG